MIRHQMNQPEKSEEDIIELLQRVLVKIETAQFYATMQPQEQEDIESIQKSIHLNLTNNCNLRCKHCYMSAGKQATQAIDYENLLRFLDPYLDFQSPREIVLSGGEPLVYHRVWDLLEYLADKRQNTILFTNGLLLDRSNIAKVKETVVEVQISLEGISQQQYEQIRGRNTYSRFLDALTLLKEHEIKTTLAITVLEQNKDDIARNILPFLRALDHENLHIRISDDVEYSGNAKLLEEQHFGYDYKRKLEMLEIIHKLKEEGFYQDSGSFRGTKMLNCGIGANIVIDYDEKIYPCSMAGKWSWLLSEVSAADLDSVFSNLNDDTSVENMSACHRCELKYICSGGCRVENLEMLGDWAEPACDKEVKYKSLLLDYLGGVGE